MKKIAIIKEPDVKIDTDKLITFLNSICQGIEFEDFTSSYNDYRIEPNITSKSFGDLLRKFNSSFKEFDFIIYLTKRQHKLNYFCAKKDKLIIIYFSDWEDWTQLPQNNGFIYFICTLLGSTLVDPNKEEYCENKNTGCIYDYLEKKTEIDNGMKKTRICTECEKEIIKPQDLIIRKNLDILMKDLSEASTLEMNILDFWSKKTVEELWQLVENFSLDDEFSEEQLEDKILRIENLDYLRKLEEKIKDLTPEKKQRISTYIERGAISDKIKEKYYKCLVCEALGGTELGFKKRNSECYYIESHHVEEVSQLKKGSLSIANIITVCANHHRQMHYGSVDLIKEKTTDDFFTFKIDGVEVIIPKITILD